MTFSIHPTQVQTEQIQHNLALPAVVHPYGLLLAFFLARTGSAHTIVSSGWTDYGTTTAGGGSGMRRTTAARITDGTEGGGTLRIDVAAARIGLAQVLYFPIRQWAGLSLVDSFKAGVGVTANPGANTNPPSLAPGWGSKATQWIAAYSCRNDGPGADSVSGYPASYSDGVLLKSTNAALNIELALAFRETTAASEDPGAFTAASLVSIANTFAVRLYEPPVVGPGAPPPMLLGSMPQPGQSELNTFGVPLEGYQDIEQSIRTILGTQAGTVPFAPDFGVDWMQTIDRSMNRAAPIVVAMAQVALERYEPRIVVKRIEPVIELEQLRCRVIWAPKQGGQERSTLA